MSKKRKAGDDAENSEKDTKKLKTGSSADEKWLDGILGRAELGALAALEPQSWADDKANFKAYETVFNQIANRLLNEVIVMINGKPHRFIELEFYYKSANHPDHFTHGHPVQSKFGKWYFHRTGHSMSAYKGGTYKGMDISIGGHQEHPDSKVKSKTIHGGILIRAIQPLFDNSGSEKKKKGGKKKDSFIEGPSTVVDYIIELCGAKDIPEFVRQNFPGQENEPSVIGSEMFHLTARDKEFKDYLPQNSIAKMFSGKKKESGTASAKLSVYASPRVGLSLKRDLEFLQRLLMSSYRFHSLVPSMTKGKHHMILALHQQGKSASEISTIMGTSKATIDKYIEHFKKGEKSGKKLTTFGAGKKTLGTEDFAGLYGAWHAAYGAL